MTEEQSASPSERMLHPGGINHGIIGSEPAAEDHHNYKAENDPPASAFSRGGAEGPTAGGSSAEKPPSEGPITKENRLTDEEEEASMAKKRRTESEGTPEAAAGITPGALERFSPVQGRSR